jgi:enamine deaminase RidA (YjgF/YER057c/UK114 family)
MAKEILAPDTVIDTRTRYRYTHAIKVGNTIYMSGQTAMDKDYTIVGRGDFGAQTRQAFESMKLILESAGASMSDVVDIIVFVKDVRYLYRQEWVDIFQEYFGDWLPCVTVIQIVSLFFADLLIEIKGTAVVE